MNDKITHQSYNQHFLSCVHVTVHVMYKMDKISSAELCFPNLLYFKSLL